MMTEHFWLGMAIILTSGFFNGSFALPMKYSRQWEWENTWLTFCLVAFVILPWSIAVRFVPNLGGVYGGVSQRALLYPLAFGLVLGVAQVTYGLCLKAIGIGVTIAVTSAVSCLCGALIPLLVLHPADFIRPRGLLLLAAMLILSLGLLFYGQAGRRREKEQLGSSSGEKPTAWSFPTALFFSILTGAFGSSINLGFAFSEPIMHQGLELGATALTATYAVWTLLFGASLIPNLGYCSYRLSRRCSWPTFYRQGWWREALLAIAMAILSFSAFLGYGIGATLVGTYGTSVGWALFVAATILSSHLWGILAGEWKSTSEKTRRLAAAAVISMLISVVVLNLGGIF